MKSCKRLQMFNAKADYYILLSLKQIYESLLNQNEQMHGFSDAQVDRAKRLVQKIKEIGAFNLILGLNELDKDILNSTGYPAEFLKEIESIMLRKTEKYKVALQGKSRYREERITAYRCYVEHAYQESINFIGGLQLFDLSLVFKFEKISDLFRLLYRKHQLNQMNQHIEFLRSYNVVLENRQVDFLDEQEADVKDWLRFRLTDLFLDRLVLSLLTEPASMKEVNVLKPLEHLIKDINEEMLSKDLWWLGSHHINPLKLRLPPITLAELMIIILDNKDYEKNTIFRSFIRDLDLLGNFRDSRQPIQEIYRLIVQKTLLLLDLFEAHKSFKKLLARHDLQFAQITEIFALSGIREINLIPESPLDLSCCESIDRISTDNRRRDRLIAKVHRKGYYLGQEVFRKAVVSVYRYVEEDVPD